MSITKKGVRNYVLRALMGSLIGWTMGCLYNKALAKLVESNEELKRLAKEPVEPGSDWLRKLFPELNIENGLADVISKARAYSGVDGFSEKAAHDYEDDISEPDDGYVENQLSPDEIARGQVGKRF